ncbi:transposase [Gilvimarinus sp. SDUM040013]|uniref:Transposase n=1 Tax=Gilvimarinus gilvus TaxID=3058038 RepID=A0ABU4S2T9_9GAMM|nr:transposase [Gilvimarinus sp. SDUM040013]MDO3387521.1 transposase [Gilvimarinus sp. SDUM040013]MDX6851485.1 transposase [Gilvimarinus sp. SDUM040013]
MTQPRKRLISLDDTPFYHCVSRCVRRAFLCGSGEGYDFEHRRGWIVQRIKQLATIFTTDVAAYAIMSNHYHVVLRVNREEAEALSQEEVIERWCQVFKGPVLVQQFRTGSSLTEPELELVNEIVEEWRKRLSDISWFMRCLNEPIARWANQEDNCTGRFFEGRFKSQALLDERAVLSCMAYVDLNPIRAGMADTPGSSDFTGVQERLGIEPERPAESTDKPDTEAPLSLAELMPFSGSEHHSHQSNHLPFDLSDYLELVDWTGRAIRDDKRGAIDKNLPSILGRLGLPSKDWLDTCCHIERRFGRAIGPVEKVTDLCKSLDLSWMHGIRHCRRLYPQTG